MKGLKGIWNSKKAMMSLIILAVSALLSLLGHMDPSFAAIIASIQVIYCWTVSKTEVAALGASNEPK